MGRAHILFLAFIPALCGSIAAEKSVRARATANEPVKIDGRADESFWALCDTAGAFTQADPVNGAPASERTVVRIAYDTTALYIFAKLYDTEPSKIVKRLARRDGFSGADAFWLNLDTYHDHQTARGFVVNAGGSLKDGTLSGDNNAIDERWDCVWEAAVAFSDSGWTAEMKLPLYCLRFKEMAENCFGVDFARFIARKNETDKWNYYDRKEGGFASRFSHMTGITGLHPERKLALLPYARALYSRDPDDTASFSTSDIVPGAGLDIQYPLATDVTANFTVNPDFGQVEADRAVVNLSGFESFFPEKRPFFLEGMSIFETPYTLFYSRRIGRKPSIYPDVSDSATEVDRPAATAILGAAKVTGQPAAGLEIGVLDAVTREETGLYEDTVHGGRFREVVEPGAVYQAYRVRKTFTGKTDIGLMATAVNRNNDDNAYTGGVDFKHVLAGNAWQVGGAVIGADRTKGVSDMGAKFMLDKIGGDVLRGYFRAIYNRPHLDLNDAGYFTQYNRRGAEGGTDITLAENKGALQNAVFSLGSTQYWNFNGWHTANAYGSALLLRAYNTWFWTGWNIHGRSYDDAITGSDTLLGNRVYVDGNFSVNGNSAWKVTPYLWGSFIPPGETGRLGYVGFGVDIKPVNTLLLSLQGTDYRKVWLNRWAGSSTDAAGNRADMVADLAWHEVEFNTQLSWIFTNRVSFQLYNQLLLSSGDYSDFRRLAGPFSYSSPVGVGYDSLGSDNPDFLRSVDNLSAVLRYEYRPGSTFYAVYSTGIDESVVPEEHSLEEAWKNLRNAGRRNSFLVKISYYF